MRDSPQIRAFGNRLPDSIPTLGNHPEPNLKQEYCSGRCRCAYSRPVKLLVTGTGGGAGQAVLKSLQHSGYEVIAADGDVLGTGLYTTGHGCIIPYASNPRFIDRLLEICTAEKVRIVYPGLDAELPVLTRHREAFSKIGTTVMVSDESVIRIADDKHLTAEFLLRNGFPAPKTVPLYDAVPGTISFPVVLKPKVGGARSKGVRLVRTAADFPSACADLDPAGYVVQEFIDGPEYTCGALTLGGKCHGVAVLRRVLRDGDTYKAFVETQTGLEPFVQRVAEALQPFGTCNFQLRVRDGIPYIFEINARSSGTTHCRTLAGFNEPRMIADFLIKGITPAFSLRPITILRYWKELVVENELVEQVKKDGTIHSRAELL